MTSTREPIFHDRDCVGSQVGGSTSSASFVDLAGAEITTVDLGSPGRYLISFNIQLSVSSSNTTLNFRAVIDGVPVVGMDRIILVKTNGLEQSHIINSCPTIEGVKNIKLQWLTDKGTVTWQEFSIPYDGVPDIRILT